MKYQDYYQTLGVDRNATQQDIQKAFRKLARKYHPDVSKSKGAEEQFKKVNEAYEVLGDPEKRKRYDSLGANWKSGDEFRVPPGFEGYQFHFGGRPEGGSGAAAFSFGKGGFSDFFESIFGGGFGSGQNFGEAGDFFQRGGPFAYQEESAPSAQQAEIELPLEDVYNSATKQITLEAIERDHSGRPVRTRKTYEVRIPAGTTDGSLIRMAGQGGVDASGRAVDLLLKVRIAPHSRFKVNGFDLAAEMPLSPWEAALGATVEIPLPSTSIKMKVPQGTQTGQRLRIPGHGLMKTDRQRGDVYVEARIMVPKRMTSAERELFERLSAVSGFNPRLGE